MEYIYNLQQGNGWASFSVCGYIPEKRKEEKEDNMTSNKRLIVTGHTADDLGPQRWSVSGDKLEQTNQEDIWIDKYGELYHDTGNEYSEVLCRPPEMDSDTKDMLAAKKVRENLTREESSWLHANLDLWENEPIWRDRCLRNEDSVESNTKCVYKDEIPQTGWEAYLDGVIYTKERTEKSIEELRFFNRLGWKVTHNPSAIPEMVEELDAEWMDEITGSGVAHNPKWIQRSFNGKDKRFVFRWWYDDTTSEEDECFTKRDYILGLSEGKETREYRYAKKLIIRASKQKPKVEVLGDYGHYNWKEEIMMPSETVRGTYIGPYTRKDGIKVKGHYRRVTVKSKLASLTNLAKARDALKKRCIVHYYKPTRSCPEGFMNIWTEEKTKVNGYRQEKFLKVEHARVLYKKLRDKAISAGYEMEFHDMDKEASSMGKRWPSRQRARLLWNSPGRYIGLVKAKMLADMIC